MDWIIITTFFSLLTLIIMAVVLAMTDRIAKKLDHYVDHALGNTETLNRLSSMMQQIESKQDLMFNNAPPVPGEKDPCELHWNEPEHPSEKSLIVARSALKKHKEKQVSITPANKAKMEAAGWDMTPPKKRGRPKKASNVNID